MGSKYIMESKGLNVGYGPIHVIYDLDFKVPDGEVTIIVGPNGVGKTTLALALAKILGLEFGRIQFTSDLLPVSATCLRQVIYSASSASPRT